MQKNSSRFYPQLGDTPVYTAASVTAEIYRADDDAAVRWLEEVAHDIDQPGLAAFVRAATAEA
jgi:hypothetical protein